MQRIPAACKLLLPLHHENWYKKKTMLHSDSTPVFLYWMMLLPSTEQLH